MGRKPICVGCAGSSGFNTEYEPVDGAAPLAAPSMAVTPLYETGEDQAANETPPEMLMAKPNVVAAFRGTKIMDGRDTGRPCVTVVVSSKIPGSLLAKRDMIPKRLPGGAVTDVVPGSPIMAQGTCLSSSGACPPHGDKYRPLLGGISGIRQGGTACTLGAVVRDALDGSLLALTNNHCTGVMYDSEYPAQTVGYPSTLGFHMMQPSPYDGGLPADAYGDVKRVKPLRFAGGPANRVDAAVASVQVNSAVAEILEVSGEGFDFADLSKLSAGMKAVKSGRTTGLVGVAPYDHAVITSLNASVNVGYGGGAGDVAAFVNQIIIQGSKRVGYGGDSGSVWLVMVEGWHKIFGLNFAGNGDGTLAVANPMEFVAAELDIAPWDGRIILPYNDRPYVVSNGRVYRRTGSRPKDGRPVTHAAGSSHNDEASARRTA